jgi:hypothetical protein
MVTNTMETTNRHLVLNVGAEGEVNGSEVIQQNIRWVLEAGDSFTCSRNGQTIGVSGISEAGPLVISDANALPFKDGAFETVIANGVPIDTPDTWIGPAYKLDELIRLCMTGECGVLINGESVEAFRRSRVLNN